MRPEDNEPRYVISVAARMLGIQTHSLRYYEKLGIIEPSRSRGNIRLYSDRDIAYLKQLKTLMSDLGINLAGVEVILRLSERLSELQRRIDELEAKLRQLKKEEEA
jgi:MerR family transcriptional regulator/heat shock protein HspR